MRHATLRHAPAGGLPGALPGNDWTLAALAAGLPQERLAQVAARRAFVAMKDSFAAATRHAPGANGEWLRAQVRAAEEPFDLWLLRLEVLGTLPRRDPGSRDLREAIEHAMAGVFAATRPPGALVGRLTGDEDTLPA